MSAGDVSHQLLDPEMEMPGLCVVPGGGEFSNADDVSLNLVADILEHQRPGLECGVEDLLQRAPPHLLVPLRRPDAKLDDSSICVGKVEADLSAGKETGDELGFGEDGPDFGKGLRDLARHLLVVERGLEEELHGTPHEAGVLGVRRDKAVDDGLILDHGGRCPLPPRQDGCGRFPPAGSFRLVFALALRQHVQDILHRRCFRQPGLAPVVLKGDLVEAKCFIISLLDDIWKQCTGK